MNTAILHEETAPWTAADRATDLDALHEKLDRIAEAVAAMDARRQELEELVTDLMPAVNGAITIAIRRLDELEKNGTLAFMREAAAALEHVAVTVEPQRLRRVAANADALLRLAELAASPELGVVVERTVTAVRQADKGRPPRLRQLLRTTREPRVRRGLAATLDVLRAMGAGTRGGTGPVPAKSQAPAPPPPAQVRSPQQAAAAPQAAARRQAPSCAAGETRLLAGVPVELDAEGFMVDRDAWTREIAGAIAAENGIPELTGAHWNVIEFCREDARATGVAPGLRRITTSLGLAPREMYALFPGGPGMLAARVAGLPKPRSCV